MIDGGASAIQDGYEYDRMISTMVKLGFGSYEDCAEAEILDAVTFLYLNCYGTLEDRIRKHLNG